MTPHYTTIPRGELYIKLTAPVVLIWAHTFVSSKNNTSPRASQQHTTKTRAVHLFIIFHLDTLQQKDYQYIP